LIRDGKRNKEEATGRGAVKDVGMEARKE